MLEMIQVKRIMMTTALSICASTSIKPLICGKRMPTITMAMAPAAWAEVRPNIMLPEEMGILNPKQVA